MYASPSANEIAQQSASEAIFSLLGRSYNSSAQQLSFESFPTQTLSDKKIFSEQNFPQSPFNIQTPLTLESIENHALLMKSLSLSEKNRTESIKIPSSNNISDCLKSFLNNQENAFTDMSDKIENCSDNMCSSSSSSLSSENSHLTTPATLVTDIVTESFSIEHSDDFIKSLRIPLEVLDDLTSRFLLNMPPEEKDDPIRICFQIENAFWHYLDFCCACDSQLPKFKFVRFAQIIFTYVPRLRQFLDSFDDIISKWIRYKFSIPCSGAIMLDKNLDFILLVQGFSSKTWGFPKGKVNHDESLMNCAVREVFEETGYNCKDDIFEDCYLERKIFESKLRLYLVKNIEFNFDFKPQARNEIRSIKWFALKDFPYHEPKQTNSGIVKMPPNASKFVSVMPFINAIRRWAEIEKKKLKINKKIEKKRKRKLEKSLMDNPFANGSSNLKFDSSSSTTFDDTSNMSDDLNTNTSTTSFVNVDLKSILGFQTMYDIRNDKRQLMTKNELRDEAFKESDRKNFESIWNKLLVDYQNSDNAKLNLTNENSEMNNPPIANSYPQVRTLQEIENELLSSPGPNEKFKFKSIGSKFSCEKLNELFDYSLNSNQQCNIGPNVILHQSSATKSSSISSNGSNTNQMISNLLNICTGSKSSQKDSIYANSNIMAHNNCNSSGQTVISNSFRMSNQSATHENTNERMNDAENSMNRGENITLMLNQMFMKDILGNDKGINQSQKIFNQVDSDENCFQNCNGHKNSSKIENFNSSKYNGLNVETVKKINPKIELLLKRLACSVPQTV
ncbi:hypothetical protein NH340_JMT08489 [Sarcoptes scabiei]|nr:hypothetical protein NH340_JMT08489 [Sarcoptes scabiei]